MARFIYKLEITDGEHQYYSQGVLVARNRTQAIKLAGEQAEGWYEDEDGKEDITEKGDYPIWSHQHGEILCGVYQVKEITKQEYNILKKYI